MPDGATRDAYDSIESGPTFQVQATGDGSIQFFFDETFAGQLTVFAPARIKKNVLLVPVRLVDKAGIPKRAKGQNSDVFMNTPAHADGNIATALNYYWVDNGPNIEFSVFKYKKILDVSYQVTREETCDPATNANPIPILPHFPKRERGAFGDELVSNSDGSIVKVRDCDVIVYYVSNSAKGELGQVGTIGAKSLFMFSHGTKTLAHEIGHCFGLFHPGTRITRLNKPADAARMLMGLTANTGGELFMSGEIFEARKAIPKDPAP